MVCLKYGMYKVCPYVDTNFLHTIIGWKISFVLNHFCHPFKVVFIINTVNIFFFFKYTTKKRNIFFHVKIKAVIYDITGDCRAMNPTYLILHLTR